MDQQNPSIGRGIQGIRLLPHGVENITAASSRQCLIAQLYPPLARDVMRFARSLALGAALGGAVWPATAAAEVPPGEPRSTKSAKPLTLQAAVARALSAYPAVAAAQAE